MLHSSRGVGRGGEQGPERFPAPRGGQRHMSRRAAGGAATGPLHSPPKLAWPAIPHLNQQIKGPHGEDNLSDGGGGRLCR